MPTWPGTLPQSAKINSRREIQDGVIRSKMDAGPLKMRPKFSAITRTLYINLTLTGEQYEILEDFYIITLAQGTIGFDWADPRDDTTHEYKFASPPTAILVSGNSVDYLDSLWTVNMVLERQP